MTRPLVSGFSFVRNAIQYGYPVAEALRSLAPMVDELIVAVGKSDDDTFGLIGSLDIPGLRIIETVWDDTLRVGGHVLAQQTNLALSHCRHPWAFYLQADEVLHEADYPRIRQSLERWAADPSVDALRFRFVHFEGTYAYVNKVRYRTQCRVIRNNGTLQSIGDAAGFGRKDGARLRTQRSGGAIYHYGWARAPEIMRKKTLAFDRMWHQDDEIEKRWQGVPAEEFSQVDIAFRFRGTHPAAMREKVGALSWTVPPGRRPPLDTPLLNPRFYAAWLRKWRLLPGP